MMEFGASNAESLDLGSVLHAVPALVAGEDISPDIVEPAAPSMTTRITKTEVQLLKALFFHVGVEQRSKMEVAQLVEGILLKPRFSHLKASQVKRVVTNYVGEMRIRRGVGALFLETTNAMAQKGSVFAHFAAVTSLCRMKALADCNEYNAMPAEFYNFLARVALFYDAAARAVFEETAEKDHILWPADIDRISSFAQFGRLYLLGYYRQCWEMFSLKENTAAATTQTQGRPDLSLADLEMNINVERRLWRTEQHPMLRLFLAPHMRARVFLAVERVAVVVRVVLMVVVVIGAVVLHGALLLLLQCLNWMLFDNYSLASMAPALPTLPYLQVLQRRATFLL